MVLAATGAGVTGLTVVLAAVVWSELLARAAFFTVAGPPR
jgi:hypothetical protein